MKKIDELTIPGKKLSLAGARELARLAENAALKRKVPGAVAVVDDGGNLILAERWDNTMVAALQIAIDKAITALSFQRPTSLLEDAVSKGRLSMLNPSRNISYVPLKGGYPIYSGDILVGAIAISGTLNADFDEEIAVEILENFQESINQV